MACSCNKNKKKHLSASAQLVTKMRVTCEACTESLRGVDGTEYPIHQTSVIVTVQQIRRWQDAGHVIQIVS